MLIKDKALSDVENLMLINDIFYSSNAPNVDLCWCEFDQMPVYMKSLYGHASQYVDLSKAVGIEYWSQNNTRPKQDWHKDWNEEQWQTVRNLHFPLCSIVYYPLIANLKGGDLRLEDVVITPKTNRMVVMPPNTFHQVDEFEGTRLSFLINVWDKPIVTICQQS